MTGNVVPNDLSGHLVANGSNKIAVFPKLFTPQLFLYYRVLLEYGAGTDALQYPYRSGNGVPGLKGQKYMDMVFRDFKGISLKNMILGYPFNYPFSSISDVASQNPPSIVRIPDQMVFGIIDRMAGSFQFHAGNIA
jgi:hypothetical protein